MHRDPESYMKLIDSKCKTTITDVRKYQRYLTSYFSSLVTNKKWKTLIFKSYESTDHQYWYLICLHDFEINLDNTREWLYTTIGAALIDTSLSDIREIRHDDIWLEYDDVVDIRKSGYLAVLYEYYIHIDDLSLSWLITEDSVTVNGIIYKVTYVSWNSGDDSFIDIFNHCHIWYQILRRYSKRDM